jgi:Putative MetA-pathway of phenol degradation
MSCSYKPQTDLSLRHSRLSRIYLTLVAIVNLVGPVLWAQDVSTNPDKAALANGATAVDRTQYNLFNPTPAEKMRDFMPDRPSVTDDPYTVDPGHWMFEIGVLEYTRDRYHNQGVRLDSFSFGDTNIRLGVLSFAELDILFVAYTYALTTDKVTDIRLKQSGFSDVTLQSKINLLGNDGGAIALGLIPFVMFPTGARDITSGGYAGGVGFPFQVNLPSNFSLTAETTVRTIHASAGGSYFDFPNSICIGHPITKQLSTYLEFATETNTQPHTGWVGTVDTALIYQPGNNWQFDAGINVGVTRAAQNLFSFVGMAWRY